MSARVAGRFTELRRLGEGGMGSVSLAHDHATGAACALKRVHIADDAQAVARLQAEFAALSKVRHPALVEVRDLVFERGTTPVLVMEFVPGLPADHVVPRGDPEMLVRVALRAAEALAALHDAGVVHGDLKPANLLVSPGSPDDVRLVDLGLAAVAGHERPAFAGTPGYAAGELRRGSGATPATDLFALGATMHALLTGALPHSSRSGELSADSTELPSDARALEREGATQPLVSLILQLMASAPAERPRDARTVVRALARMSPSAQRPLLARLDAVRFVGREREIERVLAAHRGSAGAPARVLVHGEPGMGKSALLDAVAVRLRGEGVCVALLPAQGDGLHALAVTLAGASGAAPPDPQALRDWLDDPQFGLAPEPLEALLRWLTEIAARMAASGRPPAILVDDFDRLDHSTRAALRRLALTSEFRALHVWATTRPDAATAQLVRAGEMQRVALRPLEPAARPAFVAARLGAPAPPALLDDLERHAAGHPARMLVRLRAVITAAAVRELDGGLVASASALATVTPSDSETAGLAARSSAIPGADAVMLALALAPRPLTATMLLLVADGADASTLTALLEQHLLREEQGLIRLDSPALADAWVGSRTAAEVVAVRRRLLALEEFTASERFRLLASAGDDAAALTLADDIAAAGGGAAIAHEAARIAHRAGDARACRWHLTAAREDRRVGRYVSAEREYAAARTFASGDEAFESIEGWITAKARLGQFAGLRDAVRAALADGPPPRWRCALLLLLAGLELDDLPQQEVLELLAQARQAGLAADGEMRAQSGRMLADTLRYFGRESEALAVAEETLRASAGHESATTLRLEGLAGALLQRAGQTPEALARLSRAQMAAEARGEHFARLEIMLHEASARMEHGDWAQAAVLQERAFRLALALDVPRTAALAAANLLVSAALTGDLATFAQRFARVRRLSERSGAAQAVELTGRIRALAEMARGRPALGRRCLERSMADRRVHLDAHARRWSMLALARCEDESGALDRAWAAADEIIRDDPSPLEQGLALAHRGLLHVRLGHIEQGTTDLRRLQSGVFDRWGQVLAHRAVLAAACAIVGGGAGDGDDGEDAQSLAAEMVRRFEALPAPHEMSMALLTLSELAIQQGRIDLPVSTWIEQARERAERLGNAHAQLNALGLRERWSRLTTPTTPRTEDMTWLAEVSVLVQHIHHTATLAQKAMALVCHRMKSERGVLLELDRARPNDLSAMRVIATYGDLDDDACREALGYSTAAVRRVIEGGQGIRNSDVSRDPNMVSRSLTDMRVQFLLCEPLLVAGRPIGAVYLQDRERERAFEPQDTLRLQAFARIMAAALEQSWRQAALEVEHERLVDAHAMLKQRTGARFENGLMIGEHDSMQRVYETIERVAPSDAMVLITGESGTGKELVARSIHAQSPRRDGPFVSINCGAINANLIESELFGIRGNVATDVSERAGKFEHAHGGTLFLDEIAEMPLAQQVALLHVLQSREVTRVGAVDATPVNVRVIAATNRDLDRLIAEQKFRDDLYYRLNVVPIHLPPLRERRSDILLLARHLVARIAARSAQPAPRLSPRFVESLLQHDWPGNVRELENYLERVMLLESGEVLDPVTRPGSNARSGSPEPVASVGSSGSLDDHLEQIRRQRILTALETCSGNQSQAARVLGMTESRFRFWLKKLEIRPARNS